MWNHEGWIKPPVSRRHSLSRPAPRPHRSAPVIHFLLFLPLSVNPPSMVRKRRFGKSVCCNVAQRRRWKVSSGGSRTETLARNLSMHRSTFKGSLMDPWRIQGRKFLVFVLVFEIFKGKQRKKISNLKAGVQTIAIKNNLQTTYGTKTKKPQTLKGV